MMDTWLVFREAERTREDLELEEEGEEASRWLGRARHLESKHRKRSGGA